MHEAGTKYSIQEDDTLYAVYEEKAKKTFTADFYSGSLRQLETVSKTEEEPTASTDITAPSLQAMEGWEAVGWERESPSLYNGDVKPNTTVTLEQEKTDFYGIYQKEVTLTYDSADKAVTADVTMPGEGKETCYANVHKDEIT